jgi:hypothetical protein
LLIATQMVKNMNFIGILMYNNRKGFGLWSNALQGEIFCKIRQGPKEDFERWSHKQNIRWWMTACYTIWLKDSMV